MGYPQDGISLVSLEAKKNMCYLTTTLSCQLLHSRRMKLQFPNHPMRFDAVEGQLEGAQTQIRCWLEHSIKLIEKETMNEEDIIAWSAYHDSLQCPSDNVQPALTQLLPLFHEKAATSSMIKHRMDLVRETIQFLNLAQIPVIALDAPLYALANCVQ